MGQFSCSQLAAAASSFVSSPSYYYGARNLIDGLLTSDWMPGLPFRSASGDLAPWVLITFAATYPISSVQVYLRTDCCTDGDVGDTVELLDADAYVVWSSVIDSYVSVNGTIV